MGGKDAIVVDDEADLDAAVEGVATAAFGFSGQKCSACSRAIVTEKVYDRFLEKLVPRVKSITMGSPTDSKNYMGPVINKAAMKSILEYIEVGKKEGRLLTGGAAADGDGYFVQPTVIADVSPKARIFQEEIFGPVLAVTKARDFDDALAHGQRHRVWPDRRGVLGKSGEAGKSAPGFSRREPLPESQVHRRSVRRASLRRVQHVRHRFQIGRPGLFAAIPAGQNHQRKNQVVR
jgi:uncharacterized protein YciI